MSETAGHPTKIAGAVTAAEAWASQYRAGKSLRQIGDADGVFAKVVHAVLRDAGVAMRPPGGRRAAWHARAIKLRAQGLSAHDIAERFGVSPNTVWDMLRKARLARSA